jgi:2-dehydro-3-deoxyglucarate aldolase/4-hydroxy-2-oxoheptanedioate aldolase
MPRKTLRRRVRDGELVKGVMVFECFSPGVATLARLAGAEYVLYDMEHTGLSIETLKGLVATCRGLGVAPMARVPRGEYHLLAPALDVGCHGVMVPMVESAEQARAIVDATRYPPTGRRGAAFGFAHDDYAAGDIGKKIKMLDARNTVIAQIETERGLENVEAIVAVEEIDVLWVGHFDLTNFLGIPAQFDNPLYLKALKRIIAAARKHRKGLGFMATDAGWSTRYHRLGFNMLAGGTDQAILMNGWKDILSPLGKKPRQAK